ncbi:unnamed protein product [Taenia asiatica]|uniref:MFS domain-containing protein n=1 Tax=Taenia asiatica TaxID=60517 RepID=A0A0R3WFM6_TAEAS|nr:unnamed protein product [Taenia asiatica]
MVIAGLVGSIVAGAVLKKTGLYRRVLIIFYFLSVASMGAFMGSIYSNLIGTVFLTMILLGGYFGNPPTQRAKVLIVEEICLAEAWGAKSGPHEGCELDHDMCCGSQQVLSMGNTFAMKISRSSSISYTTEVENPSYLACFGINLDRMDFKGNPVLAGSGANWHTRIGLVDGLNEELPLDPRLQCLSKSKHYYAIDQIQAEGGGLCRRPDGRASPQIFNWEGSEGKSFFQSGFLPLGFEYAAEITYPIDEGLTSGILNTSAHIFGIILTQAATAMIGKYGSLPTNIFILVFMVVAAVPACFMKDDLKRQRAHERLRIEVEPNSGDEFEYSNVSKTKEI